MDHLPLNWLDHSMNWECCTFFKITMSELTLSLPRVLKSKLRGKNLEMVQNEQYHMNVLLNSFNLNGHTLGFHPQTQKLQPHLLTQGLTL